VTDPVAPVVETVTDPVTDPLAPVVETVTEPVTPSTEPVAPAGDVPTASPGLDTATPAPTGEPGVYPGTDTVAPVVESTSPISTPVVDPAPDAATPGLHRPSPRTDLPAPPAEDTTAAGCLSLALAPDRLGPIGSSFFLELKRASDRATVAPARTTPDEAPELPGAPSSGGPSLAPAGTASQALYAILIAFAALALCHLRRLQLQPVRWRCAAFVALLERPG